MLHSPLWLSYLLLEVWFESWCVLYKREKWFLSLFMIYDNRSDALSKKLFFLICRSAPFPFLASFVPWGLFYYLSIIKMHFPLQTAASLLSFRCPLHVAHHMWNAFMLWDFLRSKDFHFSCAFLTEQGKALTFFILRASSRLTNIYMVENGWNLFICLQIEPLSCFPCIGVHPCARLVIEKMLQRELLYFFKKLPVLILERFWGLWIGFRPGRAGSSLHF